MIHSSKLNASFLFFIFSYFVILHVYSEHDNNEPSGKAHRVLKLAYTLCCFTKWCDLKFLVI